MPYSYSYGLLYSLYLWSATRCPIAIVCYSLISLIHEIITSTCMHLLFNSVNDRTDVGIKHMMNLNLQKEGIEGVIGTMRTYKNVSYSFDFNDDDDDGDDDDDAVVVVYDSVYLLC